MSPILRAMKEVRLRPEEYRTADRRGEPLEFDDKSHGPALPPMPNWLKGSTWASSLVMALVYLWLRHH